MINSGDLVQMFFKPQALGVILGPSDRTNVWGDEVHRWWWIVTNDGRVVEEVEKYLGLISVEDR